VSGKPFPLERAVGVVLTAGLMVSSGFLIAGLLLGGRLDLLRWGTLFLMMTPVLRVVVVTVGLIRRRDWLFSLISLWILGVLASTLLVAAHLKLRP